MPSEMAPCPKCRQLNSAVSEECMFCDAPLPWAKAPESASAFNPVGAPIANPNLGPVVMPKPFGHVEANDKHEWWITIVAFLFPIIGVGLLASYAGKSPLKARSALYGIMPGVLLVALIVLIRLSMSAAAISTNLPVAPPH